MRLTLSVKSFHVPATPFNISLAAKFPFRADFPRHARHLRREGGKLVHHRVDGVFQFQDLAFDP